MNSCSIWEPFGADFAVLHIALNKGFSFKEFLVHQDRIKKECTDCRRGLGPGATSGKNPPGTTSNSDFKGFKELTDYQKQPAANAAARIYGVSFVGHHESSLAYRTRKHAPLLLLAPANSLPARTLMAMTKMALQLMVSTKDQKGPSLALGACFDINVKVEYPKPKRIVFFPSAIWAQFWFLLVFENLLFLPFPPVIG